MTSPCDPTGMTGYFDLQFDYQAADSATNVRSTPAYQMLFDSLVFIAFAHQGVRLLSV